MRVLIVVALVLMAVGGFILIHGLNYPSERSTFTMGDFHASVEQQRNVPNWVGMVLLAGGIVLLGVGVRRRGGGT